MTGPSYRLDYPCPSYLACVAVGRLQRVPAGETDGIPITYWGPAATPTDWLTRSFAETASMLHWLARKVGTPFPFPKYDQIAVPAIRGAMENISLVTWNHVYLVDAVMARERQHVFNCVNIHEMAHSYFGDALVRDRSDEGGRGGGETMPPPQRRLTSPPPRTHATGRACPPPLLPSPRRR